MPTQYICPWLKYIGAECDIQSIHIGVWYVDVNMCLWQNIDNHHLEGAADKLHAKMFMLWDWAAKKLI